MRKVFIILMLIAVSSSLFLIKSQGATIGTQKNNSSKTTKGKQNTTPSLAVKPQTLNVVPCTLQKPCITKLRFINAGGYKVGRSQGPVHFTEDRINMEFETIPSLVEIIRDPNQQPWMIHLRFEEKSGNRWVNLMNQESSVWKFAGPRGSGWFYYFPRTLENKIILKQK